MRRGKREDVPEWAMTDDREETLTPQVSGEFVRALLTAFDA